MTENNNGQNKSKFSSYLKMTFIHNHLPGNFSLTMSMSQVDRMALSLSWLEYSHDMREVLGSSPGVTVGGSVWVRARDGSSKWTISSVPARFRADSGTNLFKQGKIVAGRPCGSIALLARVLARCARGPGFESRSGHVLFPPCDKYIQLNTRLV